MNKPNQEYMNLRQTADYLGMSLSTAHRSYPTWVEHGVIPSRLRSLVKNEKGSIEVREGRNLRFKRSEIDRMMDQLKVVKK